MSDPKTSGEERDDAAFLAADETDEGAIDEAVDETAEGAIGQMADGMDVAEADRSDEELNAFIEQLCLSKAEEFHLLGYENVTGKEIWECVSDAYAKHGVPLLYQIVNDILSLKVTDFMNWMTLQAYKQDDLYKEFRTLK